jgi:hypothetical protein
MRTFRCQDSLWDEVIETVQRRNLWSRERPWTLSDFIGIALKEKIRKMARSRKGDDIDPDDRLSDELIGK